MEQDSLTDFIKSVREIWRSLDSDLVAQSQRLLEKLAKAPVSESWLAALALQDLNESRELYRDPKHGFILLAHTEDQGLYRIPHDHGDGWVIYAVQRGEMEMGTYARIQGENGRGSVVRREIYRIQQGQSRVYLPGDIHDTRCISNSVLMLRLTSCDLETEKQTGRMHRYTEVR